LAATNHDLDQLVAEGRFRKDLYYRLNVVRIVAPPLRARVDDIAELAHYFLFRFDRELGLDLRGFAPETLERFQTYAWPGNVRELQSVIKQAMLNASGHLLLPEFLPATLARAIAPSNPVSDTENMQAGWTTGLRQFIEDLIARGAVPLYEKVLEAVERILLPEVLASTHGNQTQASDLLGLNRATLRHKLRNLGLIVDKTVTEDQAKE
ncbi:MAG TPA: helix-turn-helix domain-containing protein, partial [Gemmataceae bacterium]|nr:helix-turn-helix domain-containing protein [Gemmataceae bacterium]